jgi:pimeloyl-ACP methyl ester carboxylesterase
MNLLLLHCAIGSSEQLIPLANLLKNKFNVHTMDFDGHGNNKNTATKFSIELFAQNILDWMDENKIVRIHIFGYSMGGYVALYLASLYPERVDRVFTFATKFDWSPEIANAQTKLLNPEKILEKLPAFAQSLEKRHQLHNWKEVLRKTSSMMISMGEKPPISQSLLSSVTCPVLLAVGDKDKMVSVDETKRVSELLQNSRMCIMSNTSHPIEEIDILNLCDVVSDFFTNPSSK